MQIKLEKFLFYYSFHTPTCLHEVWPRQFVCFQHQRVREGIFKMLSWLYIPFSGCFLAFFFWFYFIFEILHIAETGLIRPANQHRRLHLQKNRQCHPGCVKDKEEDNVQPHHGKHRLPYQNMTPQKNSHMGSHWDSAVPTRDATVLRGTLLKETA